MVRSNILAIVLKYPCSSVTLTCSYRNYKSSVLKKQRILRQGICWFMHMTNFFRLSLRRKLFFLLLLSSIVLISVWTWIYFGINKSIPLSGDFLDRYSNKVDISKNYKDPLRKLILQVTSQTLKVVSQRKKAPILKESYLFEDERLRILENQQRSRNIGMEDANNIFNNMDYDRVPSSFERQLQYERELQRMGVPVISGIGPEDPQILPPHDRLVHLDLKGAPPKLSYLKQLLPVLKTLGATGLLIEYEDMFPYTGALNSLAAKNAYNTNELKDFLQATASCGLNIIPLIQTFGHMEFVLKLEEFMGLREIPESPQSICPAKQEVQPLIEDMLTQVIEFHLDALTSSFHNTAHDSMKDLDSANIPIPMMHIHIGCDEVYRMGICEKCRQRSKNEIFLTHVITISNYIRSKWPDLKVIIWDDMLRHMTLSEMNNAQIGRFVEPMIWVYGMDIYQFIPPHLWDIYSKVFPTAWVASAFKGAFGESLLIPPLQRHLENNMRWLAVITKEGKRFSKGFKGLALTGWQRYDHFAILCELLPSSMPSLITSLSTVSKGYFSTDPKENGILRVLQCAFHPDSRHSGHPWIELNQNSHHSQLYLTCNYFGSELYKYSIRLFHKLNEAKNFINQTRDKSAWMSSYNVRHNFSSPLLVRDLTLHIPSIINDLTLMSKEACSLMQDIYDEHTIGEFIEQNIYPVIVQLRKQLKNGDMLLQRNVWPQRPLPYARELIDLNLLPNESEKLTDNPVI